MYKTGADFHCLQSTLETNIVEVCLLVWLVPPGPATHLRSYRRIVRRSGVPESTGVLSSVLVVGVGVQVAGGGSGVGRGPQVAVPLPPVRFVFGYPGPGPGSGQR